MSALPPSSNPPGGPPGSSGFPPGGSPPGAPWDTISMGPPPAHNRRWRVSRPLVITGVVAIVVGAGGGVAAAVAKAGSQPPASPASNALAAPDASSPTPSAPPRHRIFGPGKILGLGGIGFGAIHGQFVVPKSGGGYQTMDTQRGTVTAVSNTSITLKSADGFTKTYTVTGSTIVDARRDGIGSIKVGDQAAVVATVSGGTTTAANIADITNLQNLRQQLFGGSQRSSASSG